MKDISSDLFTVKEMLDAGFPEKRPHVGSSKRKLERGLEQYQMLDRQAF